MGLILNKDWFVHVFVVVSPATESKCWQVFFKVQTKLKNLFGTKWSFFFKTLSEKV